MVKAVKKDTGNVIYMRLMKHNCPVCQKQLKVVKMTKLDSSLYLMPFFNVTRSAANVILIYHFISPLFFIEKLFEKSALFAVVVFSAAFSKQSHIFFLLFIFFTRYLLSIRHSYIFVLYTFSGNFARLEKLNFLSHLSM